MIHNANRRMQLFAALAAAAFTLTSYAGNPTNASPPTHSIDLDKASVIALPTSHPELTPVEFRTADGKSGWTVRIPGARPIATPAYAKGLLFVGGGYGSHEFYAFDSETGKLAWKINIKDDGPTAAVVEDGYVAFNTESCTVVVVDAKTGKLVWQEWLGDPLMSQPAISKGKLFMAYPSNGSKGGKPGHRLLAADLKSGKHLWEQETTGDAISAPIISGDTVYLTCFDGTTFAIDANTGRVLWKKSQSGTSAPLIANGEVVVTLREQQGKDAYEGIARLDTSGGRQKNDTLLVKEKASYLARENGGGVAVSAEALSKLDSSVGFSSAPAVAKLGAAARNVGVSTVAGAWAYQGSRAAYRNGQVMNAQGSMINSFSTGDGKTAWRAEAKSSKVRSNMQVLSPPAVGSKNLYLTSSFGHILQVDQKDGSVGFNYMFNAPIAFQPALANGNVYAGTTNGI